MPDVELYDCTLRDGAQMEGLSFSLEDKIKIARKLDELGMHYIEGGYPASNPKDAEFFRRAREMTWSSARIAAFGSTRRSGGRAESDPGLKALLDTGAPVVTMVGKSHIMHVTDILETTPEENISMISDSVRYVASHGREAFFDAEHFFDGFAHDPDYALSCVRAADRAGASRIILCDTNGGMVTRRLVEAIRAVQAVTDVPLGIHCHNDADLAVANSLAAFEVGVRQIQGCINGYGERCGNTNLVSDAQLERLTEGSRYIAEIANMTPPGNQPYVGVSAFAHKGGLHVAAIVKREDSYQHVEPARVGNEKRVLVSELAGQRNITAKLKEQGVDIPLTPQQAREILERVKVLEAKGYQYEGAEASFELLVRRAQPGYRRPFDLVDFVIVERRRHLANPEQNEMLAEAMAKVKVDGTVLQTAAEGNGPVNALDGAVRKALVEFYPEIREVELVDYKVRILDSAAGTAANVRVLIESTDGVRYWRTVGSSTDIIEASWLALNDSLEYFLLHRGAA